MLPAYIILGWTPLEAAQGWLCFSYAPPIGLHIYITIGRPDTMQWSYIGSRLYHWDQITGIVTKNNLETHINGQFFRTTSARAKQNIHPLSVCFFLCRLHECRIGSGQSEVSLQGQCRRIALKWVLYVSKCDRALE